MSITRRRSAIRSAEVAGRNRARILPRPSYRRQALVVAGRRGSVTPASSRSWQGKAAALSHAATALAAIGALVFTGVSLKVTQDQYAAQNELTAQSQYTDRASKAIEQLGRPGDDQIQIRLGGIYALERLAHDSPRDQPNVIEALSAFVHRNTPRAKLGSETCPRPSVDTAAALTVLGRRDPANDGKTRIDLSHLCLNDLVLNEANLAGADLTSTYLRRTELRRANLTGADLYLADLQGANLSRSNLAGADLGGANLTNATMGGVLLNDAKLPGANLTSSDLIGATLDNVLLAGANLTGADLSFGIVTRTDLSAANLTNTELGAINLPRK